ncbi:DEAD/DEAH box helicase family protein [Bacillus sp. ISL-37]|uniref:DEAD/DEAH box helicase family protein n=1 Tax=Bacillus sp. ISL-37 TaxID=2819123 RepID=UPI001BEB98BD|nr:DEAD/DEAH box helicase family protein [Bacillus sp. ISL-37]MBT2682241.1 DEAD/DEAH box helicase family protein [Bacillus sp. ISL-37]
MSKIELITNDLGSHLLSQFEKASTICILTSFVMKSGVAFLKEALASAAKAGADIKICTGDYLYITQPEGLAELLAIDDNIEIRLWKSNGVSFHPKAYLFKSESEDCFFIGSSNLSKSALNNGIEWNLSVSNEKTVFNDALDEFLKVFYADQTVKVNEETLKDYKEAYEHYHKDTPNLAKVWSETEELDLMLPNQKDLPVQPEIIHDPPNSETYGDIKPRFAQVEALEELDKTREEEYKKALVVMATGLGKTYLAGFFAKGFKKVLFIAHREEILYQARQSFKNIMPNKKYGIYNGKYKNSEADAIFASIYTLSMKAHIERFYPDEFDLIIVDEFHHAAAESYQRVLNYFKPEFLLGITATPDRNDNKDVYAICDGNVAYRLDFLDAINREWLAPFKYYGVYDETDYSQITWLGTRYDEEELLHVQLKEDMSSKILGAWEDKKQSRTIGFCSSIRQANFLSSYFNKQGYKTVSLHSQQKEVGRADAINKLESGELDVIFTVDLFNEGVDIPPVDTLLFVRPTESLTVFTQQIGRGLRLAPGKEHCVIIDLIGNYRNADVKLSLFDMARSVGTSKKIEPRVPASCELNLDLQVVNLLKEMTRKRSPRKEKLLNDYLELKNDLGRRPTYLELHLKGHSDSEHYKQEFNSYIGFLSWADELSDHEKNVYKRYEKWLVEVEKTSMSKSYKMVLLLAMLNRGAKEWNKPISSREVAPFFHRYLTETEYRKRIDFSDKSSKKLWEYNERAVSNLIETMPMTMWNRGDDGLTIFSDGMFWVNFDILEEDQEILYKWTREIAEYRLHSHFERRAINSTH